MFFCFCFLGSLSTLQFRAERIKIPPARYPRSTGSDRGTAWQLHCRKVSITALNSKSEFIPFFLCFHPRLSLTFRVQQPDSANVPCQPGDIVFHQQPITELHFHPAQDISQPCSSWWQAEGWVCQILVRVVILPSFSRTCHVFNHSSVLLSGSLWLSSCKAVNKAASFHLIPLQHRLAIYHFILISFLSAAVHYNWKSLSLGLEWSHFLFPLSVLFSDVSLITLPLSDSHWLLSPSSSL